jgi:hypothetical protein
MVRLLESTSKMEPNDLNDRLAVSIPVKPGNFQHSTCSIEKMSELEHTANLSSSPPSPMEERAGERRFGLSSISR